MILGAVEFLVRPLASSEVVGVKASVPMAGPSINAHAHAVGIWNVGRFRQLRLPLATEQVHVRTLTVFVTPCMPLASKIFFADSAVPASCLWLWRGARARSSFPSDLIRVILSRRSRAHSGLSGPSVSFGPGDLHDVGRDRS
jgi:hypothetical protein